MCSWLTFLWMWTTREICTVQSSLRIYVFNSIFWISGGIFFWAKLLAPILIFMFDIVHTYRRQRQTDGISKIAYSIFKKAMKWSVKHRGWHFLSDYANHTTLRDSLRGKNTLSIRVVILIYLASRLGLKASDSLKTSLSTYRPSVVVVIFTKAR